MRWAALLKYNAFNNEHSIQCIFVVFTQFLPLTSSKSTLTSLPPQLIIFFSLFFFKLTQWVQFVLPTCSWLWGYPLGHGWPTQPHPLLRKSVYELSIAPRLGAGVHECLPPPCCSVHWLHLLLQVLCWQTWPLWVHLCSSPICGWALQWQVFFALWSVVSLGFFSLITVHCTNNFSNEVWQLHWSVSTEAWIQSVVCYYVPLARK